MHKSVLWYGRSTAAVPPRFSIHGHGRDDWHVGNLVDRPTGSGDYLIVQFLMPTLVECDGDLRERPEHTLFVFTPGHRQRYGQLSKRWNHCWMHCHGAAVEEALAASAIPLNRPIAIPDPRFSDRHVAAIEAELRDHDPPDWVILESVMRIWIRELDRIANPRAGRHVIPPGLSAVRHHIEANLARPLSLEGLARGAGLSVSRFSAAFRRHFGVSPIRHVLRLRLQRAGELLRDRNLTIAEVARRVGFEDPFYFSRQFRKERGCSPREWRRRMVGEGSG
jgi:AraC-like DNA-binding protein